VNMHIKSILRKAWLMIAVLVLAGCADNVLRSKVEAPALYVLHVSSVATAEVAYPVTLRVTLPYTTPGLDSDRIAVLKQHTLDYFADARWSGTAAQLVQSYLVDYLHATGGFKSVFSDNVNVDADYSVTLELRDFQVEYIGDAAPVIHVTLSGALVDIKQRRSVAVLQASSTTHASNNNLEAVITAFEQAMQQTGGALAAQVQKSLAATSTSTN